MVRPSRPSRGKNLLFWKNRSPIFWLLITVVWVSLISGMLFSWSQKGQQSNVIPSAALSKIQGEKDKAQEDFAQFMETPAGKIWARHPYWDPSTCQKISEGQVFPGMSKEQAREAIGTPAKVRTNKEGELLYEEWILEGKEKMILKFENNTLTSIKK